MTTRQKLDEVKKKIQVLREEEELLEKEFAGEEHTFKDRLKIWSESPNLNHESWLISGKDYPKIRYYFEESDRLRRGETYYLPEFWEEILFDLFEYDKTLEYIAETYGDDLIDCLEEAMRTNLGSFKCDW